METAADHFIPHVSIKTQKYHKCPVSHEYLENKTRPFRCGGCSMRFDLVCELHGHLQVHGMSYFFDNATETAFPRFGSSCKFTQTDPVLLNSLTRECDAKDEEIHGDTEIVDNDRRISNDVIYSLEHLNYGETSQESDTADSSNITEVITDQMVQQNAVIEEISKEIHSNQSEKSRNKAKLDETSTENEPADWQNAKLRNRCKKKRKLRKKVKTMVSLECQVCGHFFHSTYALKLHKNREHLDKRLICEICGMELTTESALKRHNLIHAGLRPYSCQICEKQYRTKGELNTHTAIHLDVKNFMCQYCGETFISAKVLRLHIKRCLDVRPFSCQIENCGKSFMSKGSLVIHERNHTGETPFVCEVCGLGFTRADKFKQHSYQHTGDRPWRCDKCPKSFTTRDHLQRHIRTHTKEFPYLCHCGKEFAQNWNLKAHMRQHTGEQPYICDICGMSFKHNVTRKSHMKGHTEVS